MDSLVLARRLARLADDKKGHDILILNMKELSVMTDYFVIVSATNTTQTRAIADELIDKMAEAGISVQHREGMNEARWVLLDFADVVVHVFLNEEREFYNLERLWGDAPSEALEDENA